MENSPVSNSEEQNAEFPVPASDDECVINSSEVECKKKDDTEDENHSVKSQNGDKSNVSLIFNLLVTLM